MLLIRSAEDLFEGPCAEFLMVEADGGEDCVRDRVCERVIEPDDAHVVWYSSPGIIQCLHRAVRHVIVARQNRRALLILGKNCARLIP